MRKEKKEEKTNTPKLSYAKGLSHAVLKYLEEEETKAFMEKIEKNEEEEEAEEEEEEDEKSIVVAPRAEDVPKDFERKEKKKKKTKELSLVHS